MKVLKATVIKGVGVDKVYLEVDLPNPCYPYKGNMFVCFDAAQGNGEKYVKEHFDDLDAEVIGN